MMMNFKKNIKGKRNRMLCAIYKSLKREGMYLYVEKRDQFDTVPDELCQIFGKPQFVMLFNLQGEKPLKRVDNADVLQKIQAQGYYLQMPPPQENLHHQFVAQHLGQNVVAQSRAEQGICKQGKQIILEQGDSLIPQGNG